MRPVVLGHDQDPAHLLVQPVHDARPFHPADPREAASAMRQQRVDQGAVRMPGRGMHHHPCRLDQYEEMLVLEQDLQRPVLRGRIGRHRRRHGKAVALAWSHPP
jgi:hypothetical protein